MEAADTRGSAPPRGLPAGVADQRFLARLSYERVQELIEFAHSVAYPTGSNIETPARAGLALIVSGALRYYLSAADGRQVTVGYLGPGSMLGTTQEKSTSMVRVQVIVPTIMLHLQPERVQTLIRHRPDLTQALLEEAIEGLRHTFRVLAASAFTTVRSRVARDIVERAGLAGPLRAGLHLAVTHQALADATGSVREVVARTLRELRRDGIITTGGRGITILDPDRLRQLAGYAT